MINFITAIVLIILPFFANAAEGSPPQIAVSIKPIESIVANVTQGLSEPFLIVEGNASPHSYSLKPSDLRKISDSQVIIIVSPNLETFLKKPLQNYKKDKTIINLVDIKGLNLYKVRNETFEDDEEHGAEHEELKPGMIDPHIWLSPDNAIKIAEYVAHALAKLDPENKYIYVSNYTAFKAKLQRLDDLLKGKLSPYSTVPFIVFHDALQYYSKYYWLNPIGAISPPSGSSIGAKRLKEIDGLITQKHVKCIFTEPQFPADVVKNLTNKKYVRVKSIDPLGAKIDAGKDAYFDILTDMTDNMVSCLKD